MRKSEVGEVRPSQTLTTYGIGSLVDLPNMSVIVMGLDDWPSAQSNEIAESRLLRSAQSILGPQVTPFLTRPHGDRKHTVCRPTGSMRPGKSVYPWPHSRAGWSARSAGCWPRSVPVYSSQNNPRIDPTELAMSTTARHRANPRSCFPPVSW